MELDNMLHKNKSNVAIKEKSHLRRSLDSLHEDIDCMIHDFFDGSHFYPAWGNNKKSPLIDIIENDKNFQINVDLAGVNPDNIAVSVTDRFLTIEGEKEEEIENKEGCYLYQETQYGAFKRTVPIPNTANCDKAEANFKNGILKIIVPKKADALQNPRKVEIKYAA